MSRSYRKTPIMGLCSDSDKQDKRIANRRLRSKVKDILGMVAKGTKSSYTLLPVLRDVSNVWDFSKDGKRWFGYEQELMRK